MIDVFWLAKSTVLGLTSLEGNKIFDICQFQFYGIQHFHTYFIQNNTIIIFKIYFIMRNHNHILIVCVCVFGYH